MSEIKQDTAFERFCSFDAMYEASYKVCRNVRWKDSTINFEENRIETILKTEADLRACEYEQLVFSCFSDNRTRQTKRYKSVSYQRQTGTKCVM